MLTRHARAGGGRGGALVASQHGGLEVGVAAGVLDQVVAPHETLIAQGAHEALLARVGAGVAGELVGAGELLLAFGPGAREGPLTCSVEAKERGAQVTTTMFTCLPTQQQSPESQQQWPPFVTQTCLLYLSCSVFWAFLFDFE